MAIQTTAGHDDTRPALMDLQLFAEGEERGAGDGGNESADTPSAEEGTAAAGSVGEAAEDTAGAGDGTEKGEDAKPDVPEKYELDIPEGYEVDEKLMSEFTDVARELGLNNEQANKLAGMHTKIMTEAFQALNEARNAEVTGWGDDAKKQLGKEYEGTLRDVAVGVSEVEKDIPTLREAMDKTGFGNTIEGIKLMATIGKLLGEDQGGKDSGGRASAGSTDLGKIFFPNSQK